MTEDNRQLDSDRNRYRAACTGTENRRLVEREKERGSERKRETVRERERGTDR